MPVKGSKLNYTIRPGDSSYPIDRGNIISLLTPSRMYNGSWKDKSVGLGISLNHNVYFWILDVPEPQKYEKIPPKFLHVKMVKASIPIVSQETINLTQRRPINFVKEISMQKASIVRAMSDRGYRLLANVPYGKDWSSGQKSWAWSRFYEAIGVKIIGSK